MTEEDFDRIIATYPYPIAGILRRLRTVECLDPGNAKYDCIIDTAEAVTRFLSVLVLCLCRDHAETSGVVASAPWSANLTKTLARPSWGHWMEITREGLKWLHERGEPSPLAARLTEFFFDHPPKESQSAQALGRLLTIRNDVAHKRKPKTLPHELESLCEQTQADLMTVIESIGFLANYSLTFVVKIEVSKRRHKAPDFRHSMVRPIVGGDFPAVKKSLSAALESNSVLLRQGETGPYLNLDPLLVYDTSGKAPDLFFFNGMKSPSAMEYVACKHGGEFDSARSARAHELAEEMQYLLKALTPQAGASS